MKKSQVTILVVVLVLAGILVPLALTLPRISSLESQIVSQQSRIVSQESQIADLTDQLKPTNSTILGAYFSPQGGCKSQIVNWIDHANSTIHILIYSFTEDDIGDAVANASKRGLDVKVVFDYEQISQYSEYEVLLAKNVSVRVDTTSGLMHDKVAVIDGYIVLTGSYNWSNQAEENNNENLVVIRGAYIATQYEEHFQEIWNASM